MLLRIPEYLVFDPRGEFIPGQVRAWRREGDVVRAWEPEADGGYYSRELGISVRPNGPLPRVHDPGGHPVPYWFEVARDNAVFRQRIAALEAELKRLRQQ